MNTYHRELLLGLISQMSQGKHRDKIYVAKDLTIENVVVKLALVVAGVDEYGRDLPPTSEYERSLQRPSDYATLPPAEQWEIDKELGILDWDGSKT